MFKPIGCATSAWHERLRLRHGVEGLCKVAADLPRLAKPFRNAELAERIARLDV
jgi:hypothetical protein